MSRSSMARLAALALLWGSGFLWIKLALRGFSPVQIVFVRLALGSLVLIPLALHRGLRFPVERATWGHLSVAALVANAIPYTLFGVGERTVDSHLAGVLNATTPLWTALVAFLAGTDRTVTWRRGAGLTLGFIGTLVILVPGESVGGLAGPGGLAILSASASYGVSYVYMGRFLTGSGLSPIVLSAAQLAAGTALMGLALPLGGLTAPHWRLDAVVSLVVLGILGTGVAYVLNYRLIGDEGPTVASATTYLLPVVAVVLGVLVAAEQVTVSMVVGALLVLGGVALMKRPETRPVADEVESPLDRERAR
ncbi:DMT family transporter [Micromonospora sp. NPDC002575]|uniref:DMT family transporter n=1 Tax=Micromonospora sp. NPDC002575 TaxID=3364222 RepID=UPI0036C30CB2